MKTRWKILMGVGLLLGMWAIGAVVHHFQLKSAVERYRAELKLKSEPMELAEVVPPTIPPQSNAADLFLKGAALLNTNETVLSSNQPPAMFMVGPGKALTGWKQSFIRFRDATNSWEEVEAALGKEAAALKLLREIPPHELFGFHLDYSQGFGKMKFSPLAPVKKTAQRLSASALYHLHNGNAEAAIKDVEAMLTTAHGFSHDRMVISELVRMAVVQIAVATTWEILQATNLSELKLEEFQNRWLQMDFLDSCEHALLMERAVGFREISEMRRSNLQSFFSLIDKVGDSGLFERDDGFLASCKIKYKTFQWLYWWSYSDELRYLRGMQFLLEAPRTARANHRWGEAGEQSLYKIVKLGIASEDLGPYFEDPSKSDFHFLLSSSIVSLSRAFNKNLKAEVARQMTVTAIALKRYRLKHGSFPSNLDLLVPEFVATVPQDVINGKPLSYLKKGDETFLLYSIGENGVDDGGDPSVAESASGDQTIIFNWQNSRARDWVWPQPATPAEVQYYYDHPPK